MTRVFIMATMSLVHLVASVAAAPRLQSRRKVFGMGLVPAGRTGDVVGRVMRLLGAIIYRVMPMIAVFHIVHGVFA